MFISGLIKSDIKYFTYDKIKYKFLFVTYIYIKFIIFLKKIKIILLIYYHKEYINT